MNSRDEALAFLCNLGASQRLIRHAKLVSEVANELSSRLMQLSLDLDKTFVLVGAVLHDAGKIKYPEELDQPGNQHGEAGYQLLIDNGIAPQLARCCQSHARWKSMESTFEELLIALSDTLWKGKRERDLEMQIIDETARQLGKTRWDVFFMLDSFFEHIANQAENRLGRS